MKKILFWVVGSILIIYGIILMIPNFLGANFTISALGTLIIVIGLFLFGWGFSLK